MRFTKKRELQRLQRERAEHPYTDSEGVRFRHTKNLGRFLIGLVMMVAGGYLFLDAIKVVHYFNWTTALFHFGTMKMTPGLIMVPFLFGIGMVFYNPDNDLGWILVILTLIMLTFGVLSNIQFRLRTMSSFELFMILGLAIGGLGVFLSALRRM